MAIADGFDNVHLEKVGPFNKWVRGQQSLMLYSPRTIPTKLDVIGLGRSIPGKVKAEAIIVKDFDELDKKQSLVPGKIVVFNAEWVDYDTTVEYRVQASDRASQYGALAAIVRSVASESIYSVHAGGQHSYKIPVAAMTTQDAAMLYRMQNRNQTVVLELIL